MKILFMKVFLSTAILLISDALPLHAQIFFFDSASLQSHLTETQARSHNSSHTRNTPEIQEASTQEASDSRLRYTERNRFSAEAVLGADLVYRAHFGGLVKYNILDHFTIATQTNIGRSYRSMGAIVSIPSDNFKSTHFTWSQRFGAGAVIGGEHFNHTFLLMAGPNYYRLHETHHYPHFEEASVSVSTWIPDAGFLYSFKIGSQQTYFTSQLYVPFLMIPDNLMDITLSVGIGIQLTS